jgi:hypothetical protein
VEKVVSMLAIITKIVMFVTIAFDQITQHQFWYSLALPEKRVGLHEWYNTVGRHSFDGRLLVIHCQLYFDFVMKLYLEYQRSVHIRVNTFYKIIVDLLLKIL